MADHFECRNCDARLVGLTGLEADELGACPHCGQTDWTGVTELRATLVGSGSVRVEATVVKVGTAKEQEKALPVSPVQIIAPDLVEQPITAFDPVVESTNPAIEWPTDEEMDLLGIHADSTIMGIFLHAPGPADPEDHWIAELMIDGQWDHVYRVGAVPDDALADAMAQYAEYLDAWWTAVQKGREAEGQGQGPSE